PGHLDVAEPMKREMRLVHLLALSPQCVLVGSARAPQVFGEQSAVPVDDLAVPQQDARSSRSRYLQPHPPPDILPQIKHKHAGPGFRETSRAQLFDFSNRRIALRLQPANIRMGPDSLDPLRIIEIRPAPSWNLLARIIYFAHEQVRPSDR